MNLSLEIEQAYLLADSRGVRVAAASPGFDTAEGERLAVLFGERPAGVACPLAHFACPFGKHHVCVVRVADVPGAGERLGFHFLVLHRQLYRHLGDPFAIADRFPSDWSLRGSLPTLAWPAEPLAERTLEQLDAILREGDGPLLLGATQALVDGNRVVVARSAPDEALVRGLWSLLPQRSRVDLWPATFAFSDELRFHFRVAPPQQLAAETAARGEQPCYDLLNEEAVRNYPAGSYELNLQIAVESGDRTALRQLLHRRTPDETLRLAFYLLLCTIAAVLISRLW
ncbi:MAG: hypothetical protein WHU94_03750 [Thermogemmata sp.]|uniref:Uncharacterized protein n=1 Tax=Thermogemmata fonticola TaxID=2755323 RepID=A0A7V9ACC0_9BACT|nr:hypothetical protein [Thermogemmata fonticola]MBA2226869.1 hypothetical protein [Thermogemmata fonticola]MCX8139418.1 hypothetical protein [Gemmataceae bacterium]